MVYPLKSPAMPAEVSLRFLRLSLGWSFINPGTNLCGNITFKGMQNVVSRCELEAKHCNPVGFRNKLLGLLYEEAMFHKFLSANISKSSQYFLE
jgi:hypothetical protein